MREGDAREDRLWAVLLGLGGVVALGLLARQVADFWADSARPAMQQNDAIAGLGSVVMLGIVGVVAVRRFASRRAPGRGSGAPARRPRT